MNVEEAKKEVWQTILDMNRKWTVENKPEELVNYFHERMQVFNPVQRDRLTGQKACVDAWAGFTKAAKIHYARELDPQIEIFGDNNFAVVTFYFDMSYDMGGKTVTQTFRDNFSLVKEDGKWWIVADQFS